MDILEELYRGKISPLDRPIRPGSEIDTKIKELNAALSKLTETLTSEQMVYFRQFDQLDHELHALEEQEMFMDGFRTGARMMLAVKEE